MRSMLFLTTAAMVCCLTNVASAGRFYQQAWNVTVFNVSGYSGSLWPEPSMVAATADSIFVLSYRMNASQTTGFPERNASITCLSEADGTFKWKKAFDVDASTFYTAPEVVASTDGTLVFLSLPCYSGGCGLIGLDAATGDNLWMHQTTFDVLTAAPNGKDVITVGNNVKALNGSTGASLWEWTPPDGHNLNARKAIQMEGHGWLVRTHVWNNALQTQTNFIHLVNSNGAVATFNVSALGCNPMEIPAAHNFSVVFSCRQMNSPNNNQIGRTLVVSLLLVIDAHSGNTEFQLNLATPLPWGENFANVYGGAIFSNDGQVVFVMSLAGVNAIDAVTGQFMSIGAQSFGEATNMYPPVLCREQNMFFYDQTGGTITVTDVSDPSNLQVNPMPFSAINSDLRPPVCGRGADKAKSVFISGPVWDPPRYNTNGIVVFKYSLLTQ